MYRFIKVIFPRNSGHQVKSYIMIQDEVFYEKRTRKSYTPEFKHEAVSLVTEHGYSKAEAGRSLDVNSNQIRRWQLKYEADGSDAPGQGKLKPDQKRIQDLVSENRRHGWRKKS